MTYIAVELKRCTDRRCISEDDCTVADLMSDIIFVHFSFSSLAQLVEFDPVDFSRV